MEWEQQILHCANIVFPKLGDATRLYNKPTLPYVLLKHETIKSRERLMPTCPKEEIGGYYPISLDNWRTKAVLENQPTWRITWFRKYSSAITIYAMAPRELRIDPIYCPVCRYRTWEDFERNSKNNPTWLNYPLLPAPEGMRESTEHYMKQTLTQAINQFQGVPDLACQMLMKIASMILVVIDEFHQQIHTRAAWTKFLEGRQGLSWNLQLAPPPRVIMGLFARLQFMASHFMQTFEDAFYTGYFEYQSKIFGPLVEDMGARLVVCQAMELQNPLRDILEDTRQERDYQRYIRAIEHETRVQGATHRPQEKRSTKTISGLSSAIRQRPRTVAAIGGGECLQSQRTGTKKKSQPLREFNFSHLFSATNLVKVHKLPL